MLAGIARVAEHVGCTNLAVQFLQWLPLYWSIQKFSRYLRVFLCIDDCSGHRHPLSPLLLQVTVEDVTAGITEAAEDASSLLESVKAAVAESVTALTVTVFVSRYSKHVNLGC